MTVVSDDQAFVEWQMPYGVEYVSSSMPLVSSQNSVLRFAVPSGETTLTLKLVPRVSGVYKTAIWSLRSLQTGDLLAQGRESRLLTVRSE